jgi:hypothetical protein
MAIHELYRTIRNCVRKLGFRESLYVVWAYSQYLQIPDFRLPSDIEASHQFLDADPPQTMLPEWTVEHIAREVIRYADEEPRDGHSLRRWATLAEIANTLRDLENEIYGQFGGPDRIQLELIRITHRQFVWQQQHFGWRWIIRYYKIFNTSAITEIAERTLGLSIDQIYLIGMAYIAIFSKNPHATVPPNVEIPGLQVEHVERFLALTSRSSAFLRARLRAEHALDETFAYHYSSLREFPLVQISHYGKDEIACPVPTLLFWRITTGLYYSLTNQRGFATAFGSSFQEHVGEVLRRRVTSDEMTVLPEAQYQIGHKRKDTVDWLVQQGDESSLFIECKTMRLTWNSKAGLTDLSAIDQDVRKFAGAIVQVYKTIRDYKANHYPQLNFVAKRRIFPMVVTMEDWFLFGDWFPARLDQAVRSAFVNAELPAAWIEEMPYSVISLHDFEKSCGVINATGISPFIIDKIADADLKRWAFGAYCNHKYRDIVSELPSLFLDDFDQLFANIR